MTPADKRISEQLDRWLTSIELHLKYVNLDEASYRQIQPWPEHERPSRWILELAQQKVLQLKTLCKAPVSAKHESFAEALELMGFLATLVGMQNVKRFIPIADMAHERLTDAISNGNAPQAPTNLSLAIKGHGDNNPKKETSTPIISARMAPVEAEHTREMPKLKIGSKKPATVNPHGADKVEIKNSPSKANAVRSAAVPNQKTAISSTRIDEVVIADAVRLLKWGREWHELIELIARMAERPSTSEIRRILKAHKASIEAQLR